MITVYSKNNCPFCVQAKNLLKLKGLEFQEVKIDDVKAFEMKATNVTNLYPDVAENMMSSSFGHIFAGGYAAGYYSYKWAEVLSADAYAAFEETTDPGGTASCETGRKYLHTILEVGGSRPAMESFKAFRGREPTLDALLRHQGMTSGEATI